MKRLSTCAAAAALASMVSTHAASDDARTILVPGSSTVVKLWPTSESGSAPSYSISLDGTTFTERRDTSYSILLRHGAFDPLADAAPPVAPGLSSEGTLFIVQFHTQPLEAYRTAIRQLGGSIRSYLPKHSHVVQLDPDVVDRVGALPFVRWVGPYHPAYRLEEPILEALRAVDAPETRWTCNVLVFEPEMLGAVVARVKAVGGNVIDHRAGRRRLVAALSAAHLRAVAALDEVQFIDRWVPYTPAMNNARAIGGANWLEINTVPGYTGAGVRGEVLDHGFNTGHFDFVPSLVVHPEDTFHDCLFGDHGARVSGIVFGNGTNDDPDHFARGMLPDGEGIVADYHLAWAERGMTRELHTAALLQAPYFAVFQTNSFGFEISQSYTCASMEIDDMLFDLDLAFFQAQGNSGPLISKTEAWAKNAISIGGVSHFDTLGTSDDAYSGASTGPASDGRIKPDLCHFYDAIRTTACSGFASYTSSMSGTSAATPIVAGHGGLFLQMWANGEFRNEVDGTGDVFNNRPHMTTTKAMLINTAAQYDWLSHPQQPNGSINRFRQGWGLPNVQTMYELRNKMLVIDESDLVENLRSVSYTVQVGPGEPAFRATLVYADPGGDPAIQSQHRVNDLSMRVTPPVGPGSAVYWGNHGLTTGLWSAPGGSPNDIDTVENVFVPSPAPGEWTIEVIASEIIEDAEPMTQRIDSDFALVVSGLIPFADLDGDNDVDFQDLLILLSQWGDCPDPPAECPADLDGDGDVDVDDQQILLDNLT